MTKTYFIDASWKRWIAENTLLGAPAEQLAEILIKNGFDAAHSRLEVEVARSHPYLAAAASIASQLKKRDWVLHNARMLYEAHAPGVDELWQKIDFTCFFRDYYATNRPLVIRGAVSQWPAIARWTKEYLIEKAGSSEVQIQSNRNRNRQYEIQSSEHRQTMQFSEFVETVFSAKESNDLYMTAQNGDINGQALAMLWPDIEPLPDILDESCNNGRMFFWIGPSGTVTPLHHDHTNNLMAQVVGRKRVKLISPNYLAYLYNHIRCYSEVDPENIDNLKFPLFQRAKIYDVTIGPGDLLFLPVGWWHHVRSLDTSITITATNFRGINRFDEPQQ